MTTEQTHELQAPAQWKFTTARSSFRQVVADQWYRCSGCKGSIMTGEAMLERDYIIKKRIEGKTRLHDSDDCYETWELGVLEKLATRRERRMKR